LRLSSKSKKTSWGGTKKQFEENPDVTRAPKEEERNGDRAQIPILAGWETGLRIRLRGSRWERGDGCGIFLGVEDASVDIRKGWEKLRGVQSIQACKRKLDRGRKLRTKKIEPIFK